MQPSVLSLILLREKITASMLPQWRNPLSHHSEAQCITAPSVHLPGNGVEHADDEWQER